MTAAQVLMTKGDFARAIRRSPGRISQLIREGKLHGAALAGEKINVAVAKQQLGASLDPSQQIAQASPILPGLDQPAPTNAGEGPRTASASEGLIAAKTEGARLDNELRRRKLAEQEGRYVLADQARRAQATEHALIVQFVDSWIAEAGAALALEFGIDERAAIIFVQNSWREARARASEERQAYAESLPETVAEPFQAAAE